MKNIDGEIGIKELKELYEKYFYPEHWKEIFLIKKDYKEIKTEIENLNRLVQYEKLMIDTFWNKSSIYHTLLKFMIE